MAFVLPIVLGYLLGAIPFGLLLTRAAGAGDLRAIGSGNIGATNVLRTGKKGLALLTLLLDGGKGAAAVLLAPSLTSTEIAPLLAGLGAFMGHLYPVWLRGKGGKGVATGFGVLLGLSLPVGLCALSVWLLTALTTRYSSVSALTAFALLPIYAKLIAPLSFSVMAASFMLPLIVWKHLPNLRRLRLGTEPKIGR
jgi:acyl phosphate:glycerol-3-phosphate acyltransferase